MNCAQAQPSLQKERDACDASLKLADGLIKKQDNLVAKLTKRVDEKQTQNDQLTRSLIEMKMTSDKQFERSATIGISGLAIGIIATLLLKH